MTILSGQDYVRSRKAKEPDTRGSKVKHGAVKRRTVVMGIGATAGGRLHRLIATVTGYGKGKKGKRN